MAETQNNFGSWLGSYSAKRLHFFDKNGISLCRVHSADKYFSHSLNHLGKGCCSLCSSKLLELYRNTVFDFGTAVEFLRKGDRVRCTKWVE